MTHRPTPETQKTVEAAAGMGLPHEQIATLLGITDKTLRARYKLELKTGKAKANLEIASTTYKEALKGNPTLLIWWAKTQMGWKGEKQTVELTTPPGQPMEHRHTYGSTELLRDFYQHAAATGGIPAAALQGDGEDLGPDERTGEEPEGD